MTFWEAYTRLPKSTRLSIGIAGIFFSTIGIICTSPSAAQHKVQVQAEKK